LKQTHKRLEKLRLIMRNEGLDMVALIPGATMRYLTAGVHYVMERPIVLFIPLDERPVAVIPQLEVPLFKAMQIDLRIVSWTDAEGYDRAFQSGLDMLHPAGKIIGEGVRGTVSTGGSVSTFGQGQGVTFTSTGRLSGRSGSGTWRRSDGCGGTWSSAKQ